MIRITRSIAATMLLCLMALNVSAAELVMFDRKGCPWCAKWHAEIGADAYNATVEGKSAPLRVVDLATPRPGDLEDIGGVQGTPTFVLIENGKEIDRMVGYPGKQVFFGRLQLMLDKMTGADKQYKIIIVQ
jgi:thioredoxin-related protein